MMKAPKGGLPKLAGNPSDVWIAPHLGHHHVRDPPSEPDIGWRPGGSSGSALPKSSDDGNFQ
jgi:hypothetical protein